MDLSIKELPEIQKSWKYVVPLSACLNITKPYAEDITYPNFAEYVGGNILPSGLPSSPTVSDAAFTPQGTLSGMSGLMATEAAGGPQTGYPSSSTASAGSSSSTGQNNDADAAGSKSGAAAGGWFKIPATLIFSALTGGIVFLFAM